MIHWPPRTARRGRLAQQFEALTGRAPTIEQLNLLDIEAWTEHVLDLLKAGVPADDLHDAMKAVSLTQQRAGCSRAYAVEWVANVNAVTGDMTVAVMLARWINRYEGDR